MGAISALRVNYKVYSLHETKAEWIGLGLPFVTFNVGLEKAGKTVKLSETVPYASTETPNI